MRCPTIEQLPPPPLGKTGWPWTEESPQLPETIPGGSPRPKISIVTPSFNQGRFLEETIRSVLLQGYHDIEFIIIDGGSSDCSVEIIEKYARWLSYWVSEPDEGQAVAINKGFKKATGTVGAWINSDDLYEMHVFQQVSRVFSSQPNIVFLYGDCTNIDETGTAFSISHSKTYNRDQLIQHWPNFIPQPTAFFLCNAFHVLGGLDPSLHFAMDYDLWIRLGTMGPGVYFPHPIARFRVHHHSKTFHGPTAYWPEMRRVSRRHGGVFFSPMFIQHLRDQFYLFRQRIKRSIFRP